MDFQKTIRPCKIYGPRLAHVGSCHNNSNNCWKRAKTKEEIIGYVRFSLVPITLTNVEFLNEMPGEENEQRI